MICQFTAQLRKFWLRTLIVFSQEQVGLKFRALWVFLKQEIIWFLDKFPTILITQTQTF